MVKHGVSHAGAVFVSFVSSGLLVRSFYDALPPFYTAMVDWCLPWLRSWGMEMPREVLLSLFPLLFLSFAWGVAFKFLHRDSR